MSTSFYRLGKKSIWGDYGSVLIHGLMPTRDESHHFLLRRAGPFTPPIMFLPVMGEGLTVFVTQTFKEKLIAANFGDLQFKPTIKHHIVDVPWETWDREARLPWDANAKSPATGPEGGEPENYLEQEHSPAAAAKMEEIWEFIAPTVLFRIKRHNRLTAVPSRRCYYLTQPEGQHRGLFRPTNGGNGLLFVDPLARAWFEREAAEWLDFDEVVIV